MTREAMESEVAQLLLEQRRLARLGLKLGPQAFQRLKSLLLRLGYTKGIPMSRRGAVRRYSHPANGIVKDRYDGLHPDALETLTNNRDRENLYWGVDKAISYAPGGHEIKSLQNSMNNVSPSWGEKYSSGEPYTVEPIHAHLMEDTANVAADLGQRPNAVDGWISLVSHVLTHHGLNTNDRPASDRLYDYLLRTGRLNAAEVDYRPNETIPEDFYAMRRRVVVKFAKAETVRHPAHPSIAGMPIERWLRNLANDPKNGDNIRNLSKHWLTKGVDDSLSGYPLADMLHSSEEHRYDGPHPALAAGYNLMSAADKMPLDKHVHDALYEEAERTRNKYGLPFSHEDTELRIGSTAHNTVWDMENSPTHPEHLGRLKRITSRVYSLSGEKDPAKIEESIRRHAFRATHGPRENGAIEKHHNERAMKLPDPSNKNEVATRYRKKEGRVRRYSGEEVQHPASTHITNLARAVNSGDWVGVRDHARLLSQSKPETGHIHRFSQTVLPLLLREWSRTAPGGAGSEWGKGKDHDATAQRVLDGALDVLRGPMRLPDELFAPKADARPPMKWKPGLSRPKPHLFARVTLGPPRPKATMEGGTVNHHDILDESGATVGTAHIIPRNDGRHLHVQWVDTPDGENGLGPEAMATARRSLQTHYPDAQFVSGFRKSGFRNRDNKLEGEAQVERTVVALPRPKPKLSRKAAVKVVRYASLNAVGALVGKLVERHKNFTPTAAAPHPGHPGSISDTEHQQWYDQMNAIHPVPEGTGAGDAHDLAGVLAGRKPAAYVSRTFLEQHPVGRELHKRLTSAGHITAHVTPIPKENGVDQNNSIVGKASNVNTVKEGLRTGNDHTIGTGLGYPGEATNKSGTRGVVKLSRVVKYAKPNRSDFLAALRRMKSSNHAALTTAAMSVAGRMGMGDTKVLPALHDTPHGAVPGVAQAVYGQVRPESVHALAAWVNGLLPNGPGYAVFHARPTGPDTLYRIRHEGSGMDLRVRLDRAGITSRILVPHRKGFDVLVPDKGNALSANVEAYSKQHGLSVEASPGHFQMVGSSDQGQARATMRDKVVVGERSQQPARQSRPDRMKRGSGRGGVSSPKKYSGVHTPEEWIKDFKVPVSYDSPNGSVGVAHFAPRRNPDGRWAWGHLEHLGHVRDHETAKEMFPGTMHENEFFGDDEAGKRGTSGVPYLTPEEVHLATDGKEGTAPQAKEQDYRPDHMIPEDFYAMTRRDSVRKYAKVPNSEEGVLSPEQMQIAQHAANTGDYTGLGVLGDHLAENGFPNAGTLLSRLPGKNVNNDGEHYAGPNGSNDERMREVMNRERPPGSFRFSVMRDGVTLVHQLRMSLGDDNHYVVNYRERPQRSQPTDKLSRRRRALTCRS